MNDTKHTPRPWRIRERLTNNGDYVILQDVERQTATHVCEVYNRDISPADAANARLIASAPDLLDALKDAVEAYDDGDLDGAIISRLRAAIAKATGQ